MATVDLEQYDLMRRRAVAAERERDEQREKAQSAVAALKQLLDVYDTHDPKALLEAFAAVRTMFMVTAIRQGAGRHGG